MESLQINKKEELMPSFTSTHISSHCDPDHKNDNPNN